MAKTDERPVDVGVVGLKGKDEPAAVAWWKERLRMVAAMPVETARVGALTPQLRELTRLADREERRKLTRARLVAFTQLPEDQRRILMEARRKAFAVDRGVLEEDQRLVDEILPTCDEQVRSAHR